MGKRLRCRLDLLYPDVSQRVQAQQLRQKQSHDSRMPLRSFRVGDAVYAENFTDSPTKWLPGTVTAVTGPVSYGIELLAGGNVRRHVDQVRQRVADPVPPTLEDDELALPNLPDQPTAAPVEPTPPAPAPTPPPPTAPRRSTPVPSLTGRESVVN